MAENVDRMVWMGAGRPPGPGSWEASELARETNRVPLLLNCLSVLYPPAITNSGSYKYYHSNCSNPRTTTSWNLRPENSGSCPSSIPGPLWLATANGRGRASHLLRKLAHSVSSSANCHVTRVQRTVAGGSTVWWECSRGACACPQVPVG